jgi:hypothetical protein
VTYLLFVMQIRDVLHIHFDICGEGDVSFTFVEREKEKNKMSEAIEWMKTMVYK